MRVSAFPLTLIVLAAGVGCGGFGSAPRAPAQAAPPAGSISPGDGPLAGATAGGQSNTFSHEGTVAASAVDLFQRLLDEGPPEVAARLHSCQKLKIRALAQLLTSRGVDLTGNGPAAQLLRNGAGTLGAPSYDSRVAETVVPTTAGLAKLFDIFTQAAPEIIANLPSAKACSLAGASVRLFDDQGACVREGASCLLGFTATDQHLGLCNRAVHEASSPAAGRNIAVAALLAAAHTCE
jgi:hypothetical protein